MCEGISIATSIGLLIGATVVTVRLSLYLVFRILIGETIGSFIVKNISLNLLFIKQVFLCK